jgi:hypothetical protein
MPDADPAGALQAAGLQHQDPAFGTDVPLDGQVAGTWRVERGAVRLTAFERLPRETRRELGEEAERLLAFA